MDEVNRNRLDPVMKRLQTPFLFPQEPHTLNLKKLSARDGAVVAWWGTAVECYSSLARLRREEALTSEDETQA